MTDLDLSNVTWGEFLIGNLFYKVKLKNKKINKKKDLSKIKTEEFKIPLVNAKFGNNGIMYYGREKDIDYITMSIDIISDGAVSTGEVYPQIGKTGILYNAYLIKYKQNISENILLFLTQSIKSGIKNKYGYEYKATWSKVQNDKIKLPVTDDGSIDYEFMDQYIQKVKENYYNKRKEQLDQNIKHKMKITEISDLNLTQSELKNLMKIYNNEVEWGEFLICDLFEVKSSKKIIHSKAIKLTQTGIPYVVRKTSNNGIKGYINPKNIKKSYLNEEHTISFAQDSFITYYQKQKYITGNKTKILKPKKNITKNNMIFISTSINKSISKLKWGDGSTTESIRNTKLKLPITTDGSIDYEFMENFTQAMNKYIIKKEIVKNKQYLNHLKKLTYKGD